jgi:hypothetical protein
MKIVFCPPVRQCPVDPGDYSLSYADTLERSHSHRSEAEMRDSGAMPTAMERRPTAGPSGARRALVVGATLVLVVVVAVVSFLAAPVLLLRINESRSDSDLARMSNAGQAYGGLSALLSGSAAVSVAVALALQIRQIRMSQAQGVRMIQIELMGMLIQNPQLRPTSPELGDLQPEQRVRHIYTNHILKYYRWATKLATFPWRWSEPTCAHSPRSRTSAGSRSEPDLSNSQVRQTEPSDVSFGWWTRRTSRRSRNLRRRSLP